MIKKCIIILTILLIISCTIIEITDPVNPESGSTIADYSVAKESVLRNIPVEFLNAARNSLHIAFQHSSHGTHVARGIRGLQEYKEGDEILFGISENGSQVDKLEFNDYLMVMMSDIPPGSLASYANPGEDVRDLTISDRIAGDEPAFVRVTRLYLDDPVNSSINVIMWSWCSIRNTDIQTYLSGMETLISEYSIGGSNPRAETTPVTFIFMTGHAEANDNVGTGKPKDQADLIINYCNENGYFCLDYYSIDTHTIDDIYYEDTGDNGDSAEYGGNFYQDWQDFHSEDIDWFYNIREDGYPSTGAHNTQHITSNRKAYAMWWILARIAGWNGTL